MKLLFFYLLLVFAVLFSPKVAFAVTTPDFGSCLNPSGVPKASYDSGIHGIAGTQTEYRGKDSVYTQDGRYLQCFCSEGGDGIQTNWLKVSSYSQSDIEILKSQGWIYVPDGSAWGLTADPYVAYNLVYSCRGDKGGVSGTGGGSVLGISAASIAPTGEGLYIYAILGLGVLFVILGLVMRLFRRP